MAGVSTKSASVPAGHGGAYRSREQRHKCHRE